MSNSHNIDDTFTTTPIYVSSNKGVILPDATNVVNGFSMQLSNPIIMDNNSRYVIEITKASFPISGIAMASTVNIYCDIIEYQYQNTIKTQLLTSIYRVMCVPSNTDYLSPFLYKAFNPINRFINSTTKVINKLDFRLTVVDYLGNETPLQANDGYPVEICLIIKKIPRSVVSVTII